MRPELIASATNVSFVFIGLIFERLDPVPMLLNGHFLRSAEDEPGDLRAGLCQSVEQSLIFGVEPAAQGVEILRSGVERAPLALQDHSGGQGARRRIVGSIAKVEGDDPVSFFGENGEIGQFLSFGTNNEIGRDVAFAAGVGA